MTIHPDWGIVDTGKGYRFWPDKLKGEGLFIACFQKTEGETELLFRIKTKPEQANKKETEIIGEWIRMEDRIFIRHMNTVYAWPGHHLTDFSFLLEELRVIYSGILTGQLVRDKLVPDHALAMSNGVAGSVNRTELDHEQSIHYLQRRDTNAEYVNKSWQLVTYLGYPLGWVNVLPNRVNNYYPKELRILKNI